MPIHSDDPLALLLDPQRIHGRGARPWSRVFPGCRVNGPGGRRGRRIALASRYVPKILILTPGLLPITLSAAVPLLAAVVASLLAAIRVMRVGEMQTLRAGVGRIDLAYAAGHQLGARRSTTKAVPSSKMRCRVRPNSSRFLWKSKTRRTTACAAG
jgi:hypothetical protein